MTDKCMYIHVYSTLKGLISTLGLLVYVKTVIQMDEFYIQFKYIQLKLGINIVLSESFKHFVLSVNSVCSHFGILFLEFVIDSLVSCSSCVRWDDGPGKQTVLYSYQPFP